MCPTNLGAKVRKKTDMCKRGRDFLQKNGARRPLLYSRTTGGKQQARTRTED